MNVKSLSHTRPFTTPWTAAHLIVVIMLSEAESNKESYKEGMAQFEHQKGLVLFSLDF